MLKRAKSDVDTGGFHSVWWYCVKEKKKKKKKRKKDLKK